MRELWHGLAAVMWGLNVAGALAVLWDAHPLHAALLAMLCAARCLAHLGFFFGYEVHPLVRRTS